MSGGVAHQFGDINIIASAELKGDEVMAVQECARGDGWIEFQVVKHENGVLRGPVKVRIEMPELKTEEAVDDKELMAKIEAKARVVGEKIHKALPEGWGFVLLFAQFGKGRQLSYISDCNRADTIKVLREMADKLEKGHGKDPVRPEDN